MPTIHHTGPTDQTTHNSTPHIVIIDKIIKKAYLINSEIPKSQRSPHHYQKAPQVHKLERRVYKNMIPESSLYNTNNTTHNRYYSQHITEKFTAA
jgi:hypothetical protein